MYSKSKFIKRNVEIISLIYKSLDYLDLIYTELNKPYCTIEGWDVGIRLIANDATPEVLSHLKTLDIPYTIYNDPDPNAYYMNRVYRAYNFAARTSTYDNLCFINSDMVFSKNWLSNLMKHHDGNNIPTSRLVESGKMESGKYGISLNCGRHPKQIDYSMWESASTQFSVDEVHEGGLYMPCVFDKTRFMQTGMYPEGNIYQDGVGTLNGFVEPGDRWYFRMLENEHGMKHVTVFDSLVYHVQEGEKGS
tara:strand:+ start:1077 stop:1823 length:747 start_codon:yes stop_codon:yes gene_type:complete